MRSAAPASDPDQLSADTTPRSPPLAKSSPDLLWLVAAVPILLLALFVVQGSVEVRCAAGEGAQVLVDGRPARFSGPGVYRSDLKLIGSHPVMVRAPGRPDLQTTAFVWLSQRVVVDAGDGSPAGAAVGTPDGNPTAAGVETSRRFGTSQDGRFEQLACGAINDTRTGHLWLVGPDHITTLSEASAWVDGQSACGGVWRLPTETEIQALFEPGKSAGTGFESGGRHWPAHIDPMFAGIGRGSWVWVSEPAVADRGMTWNMNQNSRARISASAPEYPVRVFAIQ